MKKSSLIVLAFGIFFLFLIQLAGTLVESIYILDLLNTSLDAKALGLLFFFAPALLLFIGKKRRGWMVWVLVGLLFAARGLTPYLSTPNRLLSSGIGLSAALMLFPFLITAQTKDGQEQRPGLWLSTGLALAVGLSAFLRTVNYGLDYSLFPEGGWTAWGLGAVLVYLLTFLDWTRPNDSARDPRPVTLATTGIFLVLALVYFAFAAPSVISRWTEGNYILIVSAVSLLAMGWTGLSLGKPVWIERITPFWLTIWNLAFTLALTSLLLAHRAPFPPTPGSPAVVVGAPTWVQQVLLVLMLLLFPVIFLDMHILSRRIGQAHPAPRDLVPGMLLGSLALIVLVFMQIFTNVWGYVEPISPWFRNKFWLPYLLMAAGITLLVGWHKNGQEEEPNHAFSWEWAVLLGIIFLGSLGSAFYTTRVKTFEPKSGSLVVMTYNIQAANDRSGERSYNRQLDMIRRVQPDILALQESDSTRVSLNNNDYVRYYAGKLGYHSYYGPKTVTGTYGTALLSKYPLQNPRSVFTYSDQDEIGTTEAEIEISGQLFTVYDVHPDGTETAKMIFAKSLLARSQGKTNFIATGDYNLRDYEKPYQLIDSVYTNAWTSVYPSEISADGIDMSGDNRIDHIFFSSDLTARNPIYVLPPASATDHPVHWAEIDRGK